jgi:hypothetical protein
MEGIRFIPRKTHAILDYLVGGLLLVAPNLLGFSDEGEAAMVPRIIGIVIILQSLITDYEISIAKLIPFRIHLIGDVLTGLILLLSPFVFGFIDEPVNVWLPHILVGLMELGVVAMTNPSEGNQPYVTR